uniref:Uncharacterized protein LOC100175006 n=1 Tax=Phallusia mammillata TaxID=59560 RepID=A0A6F9DFF9_9ASCI|nr:uncharacterized protein LOC100175006 [Phallusia mammillata]
MVVFTFCMYLMNTNQDMSTKSSRANVPSTKEWQMQMDLDYKIEILTANDAPQVRKLLHLYLENEHTAKCVKLTAAEKDCFVNTYVEKVLPQGFSLGIFDKKSKKMLAGSFNTDKESYLRPKDFELSGNSPGLDKLCRFDEFVEQGTNQLTNNIERALMLELLIVDPRFSRRGLSKYVYGRMEELAKSSGFTMLIGVVNSAYAKSVLCKRGFVVFKEVTYAEYIDPTTNEAIFRDIPKPHSGAALIYKRLSPSKL